MLDMSVVVRRTAVRNLPTAEGHYIIILRIRIFDALQETVWIQVSL